MQVTKLFNLKLLQRFWKENAALTLISFAMLPVIIICLIGLVLDHQLITGVPAWIKPLKFAISIGIYCFTFVYLLTFIRGHKRIVSITGTLTALCLVVEMGLIILQVMRGTSSHFNATTPFDSMVFRSMGAAISLLWLAGFVVAILLLLQKSSDSVWAWTLRFSIISALVGMNVAFLMLAQPGLHVGITGAHSVGFADGGPGLPFLGWSTIGGDLRVPHFFGLHGLQVLLIAGWLLAKTKSWLDTHHRVALVITAGLAYLIFILLLTWQALRSQSLIHPDILSLVAFGTLFGVTLITVFAIVTHGQGTQKTLLQHISVDTTSSSL